MNSPQIHPVPSGGWIAPSVFPELSPTGVHLWQWRVDEWQGREDQLKLLLDPDERDRAHRFRFAIHRKQFVVAHGVLRLLLGKYARLPAAQLSFSRGVAGKPALVQDAFTPPLEFNLAHSGELTLLAVSRSARLGVDVEQQAEGVDLDAIVDHFFSARECGEFRSLPLPEQQAGFFACWTRKEAYIKATGLGVSEGLDYFDVPVAATSPAALLADRRAPEEQGRWQMHDVAVESGYSATLVTQTGGAPIAGFCISPASAGPLHLS